MPDPTMSRTEASALPPLYACHRCQLIGPEITAAGHEIVTGHKSQRVSDEVAAGVREVWASEERSLIDGAEAR